MGERKTFDVAEHLRRLRAEVERHPATRDPSSLAPQETRARASATPRGSKNGRTTNYHELAALQGRAFVAHAYQRLLHRAADPEGMRVFYNQLVNGRRKAAILGAVRYSTEGRARGERVTGLFPRAALARAAELPILGGLVGWIVALATLPRVTANVRRSEAAAAEVAEQVGLLRGRQNSLEADLKGTGTALRELSAGIRAEIASLSQTLATEHMDRLRDGREQEQGIARFGQRLGEQEEGIARLSQRLGEQEEGISRVGQRLGEQEEGIARLSQRLGEQEEGNVRFSQRLGEQEEGIVRFNQRVDEHEEESARLSQGLREQEVGIAMMREQWQRIDAIVDQERSLSPIPIDRFGVEFVDAFRGSRHEIVTRQHVYLPMLARLGSEARTLPILDLGSGRGEWLELLQAKGFSARGIDDNLAMVQTCREGGLEVAHGDLAQELANCPDESLGAVTAFHVVEHLSFARLLGLLIDAFRALRPGGLLIIETPNPDNLLVASRNFYLDPTHCKPLPQELLVFMIRFAGFHDPEFLPLNPVKPDPPVDRLQGLMDGAQDYAVVARKSNRAP